MAPRFFVIEYDNGEFCSTHIMTAVTKAGTDKGSAVTDLLWRTIVELSIAMRIQSKCFHVKRCLVRQCMSRNKWKAFGCRGWNLSLPTSRFKNITSSIDVINIGVESISINTNRYCKPITELWKVKCEQSIRSDLTILKYEMGSTLVGGAHRQGLPGSHGNALLWWWTWKLLCCSAGDGGFRRRVLGSNVSELWGITCNL